MSSQISGMSDNYYNMSIKRCILLEKNISDISISEHLVKLKIKALPIYKLHFIVERKYPATLLSFCVVVTPPCGCNY